MVQPNQQHVVASVIMVEWGLDTRGLGIVCGSVLVRHPGLYSLDFTGNTGGQRSPRRRRAAIETHF